MYFDLAMPLTLFAVTLVSLYLNQKTEERLKMTFEEKQFTTRDAVLLVALLGVMVTLIALANQYGLMDPLMVLFLFSYSMLLFIFTYLFSKSKFLAVLPPAVFVLLYLFLRSTDLWLLYLVNVYAVVFAVLITLYMGTLFSWKTTWLFTLLITVADVILVFVTGTMVEAANAGLSLRLPIALVLPIVPFTYTEYGLVRMALGLGDFFFAGLLSIQLSKRYGRKSAIVSIAAMAVAFFLFEVYALDLLLVQKQEVAFPATIVIIFGWLPIGLWKSRSEIRKILLRKTVK
ncbi:MAG: hypothetical protein QW840_00885 [Candidatus Bathyarchaeia archaeon]